MPSGDTTYGGIDIRERIHEFAQKFDARFEDLLRPSGEVHEVLAEAMLYSALAPGKRLRPYLVSRCCELAGGQAEDALPVGAAVECIHAFSLIHDDLPAMDDDDLRRGRPTSHKQFGEAVAILAGDALSVLAFELLATHVEDPHKSVAMTRTLAQLAGRTGMTGGQSADIEGEHLPVSLERVEYIHARKTAGLFEAACRLGAIAGGGSPELIDDLGSYGSLMGRAFQIADDLLDLTSTSKVMGKEVGKDESANKQTYPACVGTDRSRHRASELVDLAVAKLDRFDNLADDLRVLAHYTVDRNY